MSGRGTGSPPNHAADGARLSFHAGNARDSALRPVDGYGLDAILNYEQPEFRRSGD